jgi:hypothetical protein
MAIGLYRHITMFRFKKDMGFAQEKRPDAWRRWAIGAARADATQA